MRPRDEVKHPDDVVCDAVRLGALSPRAVQDATIGWRVDPLRRTPYNGVFDQSGGARNQGGKGTGQLSVIRNYRDLDMQAGHVLLSGKDGVPTYIMLYNGAMAPGAASHRDTGGHTHRWDHVVYVLQGSGTLVCKGKSYPVSEEDGVLVPPNVYHQWRNETQAPMLRVTLDPRHRSSPVSRDVVAQENARQALWPGCLGHRTTSHRGQAWSDWRIAWSRCSPLTLAETIETTPVHRVVSLTAGAVSCWHASLSPQVEAMVAISQPSEGCITRK